MLDLGRDPRFLGEALEVMDKYKITVTLGGAKDE